MQTCAWIETNKALHTVLIQGADSINSAFNSSVNIDWNNVFTFLFLNSDLLGFSFRVDVYSFFFVYLTIRQNKESWVNFSRL